MPILEDKSKLVRSDSALVPVYAQTQRRRMLVALALLLVALLLVFIRDRQFWFPSSLEADSPMLDHGAATSAPVPSGKAAEKPGSALAKGKLRGGAVPEAAPSAVPGPEIAASNRAVLAPLQVEVVAGDQRRTVHTSDNSIKVDMQPGSPAQPASPAAGQAGGGAGPATDASERVRLSSDTAQVISQPVRVSYPTLARQMKVQGSVVLQALVGKDGLIQDLRVLSGPAILSSAAQEAVKQWRFKPYYQNGQPVETQCNITVNFTISTH
jgi:protein TonB